MRSGQRRKRAYPHPRSPKAMEIHAQNWGIAVGMPLAEAFMIVRHLIKS